MKPTIQNDRIHIIDTIRGFALLGLPFVNVIGLWIGKLQLSGDTTDIVVQKLLYIFVEGRFYAIFSFLFGVGVWIFLSRAIARESRPYVIYYRRMGILFLIGLVHQFFQPGEALLIYAVLGMILPLFYRLPRQINFFLGIVGLIGGSIISAKGILPLPLMVLGIAFAQASIFSHVGQSIRSWRRVALISFLGTIGATIFLWLQAPKLGWTEYIEGRELSEMQYFSNEVFYQFTEIALSLAPIFIVFYISLLVCLAVKSPQIFKPLNAFGRMAFTNYLGQTVFLLMALHFMVGDDLASYTYATITCAIIVIFQIVFSSIWLRYFKYGPLEWIWRCGTYGKMLPIRK